MKSAALIKNHSPNVENDQNLYKNISIIELEKLNDYEFEENLEESIDPNSIIN